MRKFHDDFSISTLKHNIKIGGSFQNLPLEEDVQGNQLGTWNFANDQLFDPANGFNRVDVRISKAIPVRGRQKIEVIAQVFNLLGHDNLGGIGTSFVTNASSDTFGREVEAQPRQPAEVAMRVTW